MSNRNLRRNIVREARRWIGTPYLHQASARHHGCDCLGLVRGVWRYLYGTEPQQVPAYSPDWGEASGEETMKNAAERWLCRIEVEAALAGDLILFRWKQGTIAKHAGILTGNGRFIHAYERAGVVETGLGRVWRSRIAAAYRFPDPSAQAR